MYLVPKDSCTKILLCQVYLVPNVSCAKGILSQVYLVPNVSCAKCILRFVTRLVISGPQCVISGLFSRCGSTVTILQCSRICSIRRTILAILLTDLPCYICLCLKWVDSDPVVLIERILYMDRVVLIYLSTSGWVVMVLFLYRAYQTLYGILIGVPWYILTR